MRTVLLLVCCGMAAAFVGLSLSAMPATAGCIQGGQTVTRRGPTCRQAPPAPTHPTTRPEAPAWAEAGSNMLPIDQTYKSQTSPIFNYPYARTREALHQLSRAREADPWHGFKMKYINPVNGGWAMPTIATWMQLLPAGLQTRPYRSTDSTVYTVVEGRGHSIVGGQRFDWGPHDIFVAPSWVPHHHVAAGDAVLFGYSDRVVHEKLDLWREERLEG